MFWSKKKKKSAKTKPKAQKPGETPDQARSRQIREQALANARAARAHIGEDTLDRIAAAMTKKQNSAMERAKSQINEADPDKVLDELLFMLDEGKD